MDELADGAMLLREGRGLVVLDAELLAWTPAGYGTRITRPVGEIRPPARTP
ncbi:MAG: hypothetical protein ACLP01_14710 [Solirubrobacteraceae bacterium]